MSENQEPISELHEEESAPKEEEKLSFNHARIVNLILHNSAFTSQLRKAQGKPEIPL
jgi:hypothetical protein